MTLRVETVLEIEKFVIGYQQGIIVQWNVFFCVVICGWLKTLQ